MNYGRNFEGYPDPTASEAIGRVMHEQKKRTDRDMRLAFDMMIRKQSLTQMEKMLQCTPEYLRDLLTEIYELVNKQYKKVIS